MDTLHLENNDSNSEKVLEVRGVASISLSWKEKWYTH